MTSLLVPDSIGGVATGLRRERILASPQFRDGRFENPGAVMPTMQSGHMWSTLGEFVFGKRGIERRPTLALPMESPHATWSRPASSGLRVTWLGHSTTLLEIDGVRVLTDPVWSERASPFSFAGPRRFHAPPVKLEDLPPLDGIVVSHDHFDHLDHQTIRALAKLGVPFVTSLGVGAHLEAWGVDPGKITELDWWQSTSLGPLRVHATPARHFSGRGIGNRNATLWSSWVLETDRHRVFFSGDMGPTPELADVRARLGAFDLVMLEVGAFHPSWGSIHLGPENALRAHALLGGGTLLPVHWGTFDLALHAWDEPAETLATLASREGTRLVTPRLGQAVEPSQIERVDPWWRALGHAHEQVRALLPSGG